MLQKIKQLFTHNFKSSENEVVLKANAMQQHDSFDNLVKNLNTYFANNPHKNIYTKELAFLNSNFNPDPCIEKINYAVLPYPYILEYDYHKIEVHRDDEAGMFFVYLDEKKLYYHKGFTKKEDVQKSFTFIIAEQYPDSPHCYLDEQFYVMGNDVVVDLGAAEGNFSLMVVDKAKELIIVEADSIWMEALHKTFEPWKDKVRIINKFAGNTNDEKTVTLDRLEEANKISFVKMDIEGAEISVLNYAQAYLSKNKIKFLATTYHRLTDAEDIKTLLEKNNYQTKFSTGFMLFVFDDLTPPYFRKTLIKAFN